MNENMCSICGKVLSEHDEFFAFADALSVSANKTVVCDDCAVKTTVYDLYNRSALTMANSPDNAIEIDGTVVDTAYANADSVIVDAVPEEAEKFPSGCTAECPLQPYCNCRYYYGEIDECMLGEKGMVPTEEEKAKVREKYPNATPEEVEKFFTSPEPVFSPDSHT